MPRKLEVAGSPPIVEVPKDALPNAYDHASAVKEAQALEQTQAQRGDQSTPIDGLPVAEAIIDTIQEPTGNFESVPAEEFEIAPTGDFPVIPTKDFETIEPVPDYLKPATLVRPKGEQDDALANTADSETTT